MSELCEKMNYLETMLDTERIISGGRNSARELQSYFRINRFAYRRFHSREGFMHFRVSKNGAFSDDDIYYQPETVSGYIPPHARVLELGSGQGANLLWLAARHPDSFFCGVDLLPSKLRRPPRNLRVLQQDFNDLSNFPDNAIDVVYAIETIVCSAQKDRVFKEAYRVLKPGGAFVVYDYALSRKYEEYDPLTRKAIAITSLGTASAMIEPAERWEHYFTSNGFRREKSADLSEQVLPDLKRLEQRAGHILDYPNKTKFVFRVFPRKFTNNIIIGYLGYDACRENVGRYLEWICRT